MGAKYGFNEGGAKAASERTGASLRALATQLKSQYARGVHYFVGDSLSALLDLLRQFAGPVAEGTLPDARGLPPELYRQRLDLQGGIRSAVAGALRANFTEHFRDPMELQIT